MELFTHRFVLRGLNLERFINLTRQKDIPLIRLVRQDERSLACECRSSDLPAVIALSQEKGWRVENVRPARLSAFGQAMKKRPGVPAGIVIAFVLIMVLSQFVWRVQISGAGSYEADIVSFLHESGYHTGIRRGSVDAKALESALVYRYPQIAWFHVYVANVTLVVEVYPGVPMPQTEAGEPGDVVASRDGIVHSIRVFAGTAAVKAGDTVRRGDVLIRGVERGRDGQFTPVRASGAITARCWDSFTVHMPLYEIISAETGRETAVHFIRTPWFRWPRAVPSPEYLASNCVLSETPVCGVFLPVWKSTLTYREVSMEYMPRNADEVRAEAAEAALKQLKNAMFGDEIIDKWVDYCMIEDDILAVTATAERLVDIGAF